MNTPNPDINRIFPKSGIGRRRIGVYAIVLIGVAISGCEGPIPSGPGGQGPGHRQQQLALSPQQELQLGRRAYREILSNPDSGRVLPADSPETQRVRQVAQRIIRAAQIEPLLREINLRPHVSYEWEVNVLDNHQINAFCLPGGKIGVFTGLLRVVQNDDQLATVLSHEIAHALAHHTSERLAHHEFNGGVGGAIWGKAFERSQESEADHIGLFLMTFAGYDPEQAVRFWHRMSEATAGQGRLPEILSDHPTDARRIHDLEAWVTRARAAKQAYDEGRIAPAR
jgi:metalloendopeptidase OMA1, mitochondrial